MAYKEILPFPSFITAPSGSSTITTNILNSAAIFYRTALNTNIQLTIPIGTIGIDNTYTSPNIYLPTNTFNSTNDNTIVTYTNNKDISILMTSTCQHNILIQYKITRSDDNNFINQRDLVATLVRSDNTVYNSEIISQRQPDTGEHDDAIFTGIITHITGDVVKIKLSIIQDNRSNGVSDSKLTIFHISWTTLVLQS